MDFIVMDDCRLHFMLVIVSVISLPVKSDPEVSTISGRIQGFTQKVHNVNIDTFLGVPFAKPPVGDLRFRRPESPNNWNSTLETKGFACSCIQPVWTVFKGLPEERMETMWASKTNMSEDCLYLNLWVPQTSGSGKLSTLVWIYGGGFYSGSTSLDVYDGKYISALGGVIVVSIAYRVGTLGFLFLDDELSPGNMGLLDQSLALKWVYENIEHFRGSQDSITIIGESAGAASVSYNLISPRSKNYFQRAILQSGSILSNWAFVPKVAAKINSAKLVSDFKCNHDSLQQTIDCLRLIDANLFTQTDILPTIDGHFITKSPELYLRESNFADKNLLVGVSHDEYTYFLIYDIFDGNRHPNYSDFNRDEFLGYFSSKAHYFPTESENNIIMAAILQEYDQSPYPYQGRYMDILDDVGGDYSFKCPVIVLAQTFNKMKKGTNSVYMYSFEHRSSSSAWPEWMGVIHGDEIEYVFGLPTNAESTYTAKEAELSRKMVKYWTNFAKTGNPNVEGLSTWPEYKQDTEEYIILNSAQNLTTGYGLRHRQCHFWNEYIPKLRLASQCTYIRDSGYEVQMSSVLVLLTSLITCKLFVVHLGTIA